MKPWNETEAQRLTLQTRLDDNKLSIDRNKLGQFATPTTLANEILDYGLNLLTSDTKIRFLDPAIGTGAFYSALRAMITNQEIEKACGFEIDPHYGQPAIDFWKEQPLDITIEDFTQQKASSDKLANLLICNPPYVRHHHIDRETKKSLQQRTQEICGSRLNGLSGLYCYFLGLSHSWMKKGAIAGWLIPSEFMDVNYGHPIKEYLLSKVTLLKIHRFDPTNVQFDDALVSSAVVWFRNEKPPKNHQINFSFGGSLEKPKTSRDVPVSELKNELKWTRYPMASEASYQSDVTLGDLFSIKRGIATGDNNFFVLSKKQIREKKLPFECFTPVLPSSRYLDNDEIFADKDGWPSIKKQMFLLDTKLQEHEIKERYLTLWQYLQTGKNGENPTNLRYLCKSRRTWYVQENRPPAPFICTYMGRKKEGKKTFRFILNHSRATTCNVYLLMYPKRNLMEVLEKYSDIKLTIWKFLNSIEQDELVSHGRVYGGGLYKLEPKELRAVSADSLLKLMPKEINFQSNQIDLFEHQAAE